MKLETLYKRAKTGKIVFYEITAEDSGDGYSYIMKATGQLGTSKPVVHNEHIKQGKNIGKANETTPLEQAESQALSDWNKKKDEGYKSLEDLGISTVAVSENRKIYSYPVPPEHKDFPNSSSELTSNGLFVALTTKLPQFNTDSSGNAKPMLATDWKKVKSVTYPCLIQPKLDGVRCLMIVGASRDEGIKFLSRSGKEYTTLGHIAKDVEDFMVKDTMGVYNPDDGFILDGEIYSEFLNFQEIVAAVKKQRPESLKLKFRAYDIVNDEIQSKRWEQVVTLVDLIASPEIQLVSTWVVNNETEVKAHHDTWVQQGYEGAMLRMYLGEYGQGQRSRDLLKVKEFDETEYPFLRWEIGQRAEDLIAVLDANNQGEFRAKMVGTAAEKLILQEHPSASGTITIKHFGFTEDGLPRFPIGKAFRDE